MKSKERREPERGVFCIRRARIAGFDEGIRQEKLLDRYALAALKPAALQYSLADTSRHALHKSMHTLTAALFGLVGLL
jgi:hypothetical protein